MLALWPGSAPVVDQIVSHEQFAFATYRHARARRLANGPVCVIGDAAHSMSPQLGLGTTLAVQDALALAAAVGQHSAIPGAALYSKRRLGVVRNYQLLSKALTPCFQAHGRGTGKNRRTWRTTHLSVIKVVNLPEYISYHRPPLTISTTRIS